MPEILYKTSGTCARAIKVNVENEIIKEVQFMGGCSGNTAGVAKLVCGMNAREAIEKLSGIKCGFKNTSCPDQLAKALSEVLEK